MKMPASIDLKKSPLREVAPAINSASCFPFFQEFDRTLSGEGIAFRS
jgi:hypothetical protein